MKSFYHQIIILLTLLLFVYTGQVEGATNGMYKKLSATQCDSLVKANETNPNFVILDVRTPTEWNSYHIMGSINRNSGGGSVFDAELDALPKHKTYLLHCQSGSRSAGAFLKMQAKNFDEVYEMTGGISAWKNAGFPTTTVSAPKLMLVSYTEIKNQNPGSSTRDTIKITVTNRANDTLTFTSLSFNDVHEIITDFNPSQKVLGAEDYTFNIYHNPGFLENETSKVTIESNGGEVGIDIVFKNGLLQNVVKKALPNFTVYPNPVNEYLQFKFGNEITFDELSLFNLSGQVVFMKKDFFVNNRLNTTNLQNGIYILRIKHRDSIISKKLIVKH